MFPGEISQLQTLFFLKEDLAVLIKPSFKTSPCSVQA
jgi:hypothetical protein